MKIGNIYAKGYAGATMGGTSFMVHIEVEEGRYPEIETRNPYGYLLNILVPEPEYGTDMKFSLATSLFHEKDRSISIWGEEEAFNKNEVELIKTWCSHHRIKEDAERIKREVEENYKKSDQLHNELMKLLKEKSEAMDQLRGKGNNEQILKIINFYDIKNKELRKQLDECKKQDDILHGK